MVAPLALGLIGGAQLAGGFLSGLSQYNAAKNNARMLGMQADTYMLMANQALINGDTAQSDIRLQEEQIKSQQKTASAASGVDVSSSNVLIAEDSQRMLSQVDRNRIARNARLEAMGLRSQAIMARLQADVGISQAKTGMFTSILGGAANGAATIFK